MNKDIIVFTKEGLGVRSTARILRIKGLHSTINKELKFTGELNGIAEVITENRSLMERFATPVKFLANKFFD